MDIDATFIATHPASDVLEPMWWTGDIYDGVDEYERCLRAFSREQRLMYALEWYEGEVDNGGHSQFFFNSTGIVYPDAVLALRELNLPEGIAILTEAGRRMGGALSRDRAQRQTQLDQLDPDFGDLDTRLYALDPTISSAVTAYLRAHPAAFTFHGVIQIPRSVLETRRHLNDRE